MERKIAMVTGGANGIGLCTANYLTEHGYDVFIVDVDVEGLATAVESNPHIQGCYGDVSNYDDVVQAFEKLKLTFGKLDLLFNNSGIAGPVALVEDIEPEEWRNCIANDLDSFFYCTKLAVPLLKANPNKGSIVNMTSNAAFFGFPYRNPYTATRWGVVGLTKTWAMELGKYGINVNAVAPGCVASERIENVIKADAENRGLEVDAVRNVWLRQASMRVFVSAEEVASMVTYFASEKGRKISGQVMAIDGHTEGLGNPLDD